MKKLSTLLILAMLAPAMSFAQTTTSDCIVQPSCSELGYTQTASTCSGKYIACPFDTSKVLCVNAAPKVGDLKYSLNSSNHDGWLLCDGTRYSKTEYPTLYSVIGQKFCRIFNYRTHLGAGMIVVDGQRELVCSTSEFAVPDYRGFFLRGFKSENEKAVDAHPTYSFISNALYYKGNYSGTSSETENFYVPEYERLPRISGSFETSDNIAKNTADSGTFYSSSGAFILTSRGSHNQVHLKETLITPYNSGKDKIVFNASSSSPIYDGSHVVPANYAAYIFIYAGDPE